MILPVIQPEEERPGFPGCTRMTHEQGCLGQSFARHAAWVVDLGENHYAIRDSEFLALGTRRLAMLAAANDLVERASRIYNQIAAELCDEAGEFNW